MRKRRGTLLLSVVSLLVIGGAFESQRFVNFHRRQTLYRLILQSYQQPYTAPAAVKPNVHKNTKSRVNESSRPTDTVINSTLTLSKKS